MAVGAATALATEATAQRCAIIPGGAVAPVDPVKRRISTNEAASSLVVGDEIAWTPRNLKESIERRDLGGTWSYCYDHAGRLTQADTSKPLPGLPDIFTYQYDGAENSSPRYSSRGP